MLRPDSIDFAVELAEGSEVHLEYAVEGSTAPVESAVEEAAANVLEDAELAPNPTQSSPAAPADDAAARLSQPVLTTPTITPTPT